MSYKVKASDKIWVDGFIYREYGTGLSEDFFRKTNAFNSKELLYLEAMVNSIIPSKKMLLTKSLVVNTPELKDVGLYSVGIVDFDADKIRDYLNYDESLIQKISGIRFPVLKFQDKVIINICFQCPKEKFQEVENIAREFELKYSEVFNAEQMRGIIYSFESGLSINTGGRPKY